MQHVFIIAVENSSDQLGAGLIDSLRARRPDIKLSAIGGAATEARGVKSKLDIFGLSILGFSEAIKAYPLVLKRVKQTVRAVMDSGADAVVLIDSWGFMIRVSQGLKRAGYKGRIIKYLAPQVWAMREGRAKILARSADHLLTIHSFDAPYFERHGLDVTHVGNPMFDTDYSVGKAERIRSHLGLTQEQPICAVLFGSRPSELSQLGEPVTQAVTRLKSRFPNLAFVSPVSATLKGSLDFSISDMKDIHLLEEGWKFDVFAAADVAIACSGTVTTQLASVGVPTVVVYKVKPITWWLGKRIYKPDYISLVNISANKALMPEILQYEATGGNIARAVGNFLESSSLRAETSLKLKAQAAVMRGNGGSASDCAAEKILALIEC